MVLMQPEGGQLQADDARGVRVTLDYASRPPRRRHSLWSCGALVVGLMTVGWLYFVQVGHPHLHEGGPVWGAMFENAWWPGTVGLVLAVVGLFQKRRKCTLSIVAIIVIVLAYW